MRILIHSNSPWTNTGYGTQTAQLAPRLVSLGYEVIISAYWGLAAAQTNWNGIPILPGGQGAYGEDIIAAHARNVRADLVITLMDVWVLDPAVIRELRQGGVTVAHWMPVDCKPLSAMDEKYLRESGGIPVAMSRYGQRELRKAGFEAFYVPHAIDTRNTFTPDGAEEFRRQFGLQDRFVIGINAANKDPFRKAYGEQMWAFAEFKKRHPEAVLLEHTLQQTPQGVNLPVLAARGLGLGPDDVRWAEPYQYMTGMLDQAKMAAWKRMCDIGSNASYGEGFGLANIEFPATGVPVVVTNSTAMTELRGAGWAVPGQPWWNGAHAAWWSIPSIPSIRRAYERARREKAEDPEAWALRRKAAREWAVANYDADTVLQRHWVPVLAAIMERGAGNRPPLPAADAVPASIRDAVTERLAAALNDGTIKPGEFAERHAKAVAASTGMELAGLIADLPVREATA